jgi:hypothetical protein
MKSFRATYCAKMTGFALVVSVATAYGAVLVPGQSATAPDVWTSCATCTPVGSGIFSTGSTGPNLGFSYTAGVLTDDPNNPYGVNDLDFIYAVFNNATSTASISRITATNFSGFNTDVGYFTAAVFPGGTIAPTTVDRNTVNTVGFTMNPFGPGAESLVVVIKTNATAFSSGSLSIIDSAGGTASVMGLAPVVPEPGFVWPLGCSLLAMAAAYLRRRESD